MCSMGTFWESALVTRQEEMLLSTEINFRQFNLVPRPAPWLRCGKFMGYADHYDYYKFTGHFASIHSLALHNRQRGELHFRQAVENPTERPKQGGGTVATDGLKFGLNKAILDKLSLSPPSLAVYVLPRLASGRRCNDFARLIKLDRSDRFLIETIRDASAVASVD